ncbi:hypothetical protein J4732_12405 [Serratia marcescens]|uniref:Uncharacterized protein n=1 Tax=Serratia marcescens TaxID=615 RepID=A0A939NK18_SERMA|nr:hypothetical protein [Serratia marcescens]
MIGAGAMAGAAPGPTPSPALTAITSPPIAPRFPAPGDIGRAVDDPRATLADDAKLAARDNALSNAPRIARPRHQLRCWAVAEIAGLTFRLIVAKFPSSPAAYP